MYNDGGYPLGTPSDLFGPSAPSTGSSLFPQAGSPSGNSVAYEGGTISGDVYGGIGVNDDSSGNTVSVTGGRVGRVTGGFSANGNAYNNNVTISNATLTNIVYGGQIASGTNNNAYSNSVTIGSGATTSYNVYGAYISSSGNATGNSVLIDGGRIMGTGRIIAGAYGDLRGSTLSGNSVTINSGSIINDANIYGGRGQLANASIVGNTVTINGGDININRPGVAIYGGQHFSSGGATVGSNKVIINGGTIGSAIYGGRANASNSNASGNTAELFGGSITGNIYGGSVVAGQAQGNGVVLAGATVTGNIYGGDTTSDGTVAANTVTLSDGSITGDIYGGNVITGQAQGNGVALSGAMVTGNIYGGFATSSGTVTANAVTLSGGSITGDIYGGSVATGQAQGNEVALSGAMVTGNIYGGFATSSGTATANTVTLSGGTVTETVYGSNLASWQTDGNHLAASGGLTTVGGIQNFQFSGINSGATLNVTHDADGAAGFMDLANNGLLSFYNGSATQRAAHIMGDYSGSGKIGLDVLFSPDASAMSADSILFSAAPVSPVTLTFKALPGSEPSSSIVPTRIAIVASGAQDGLFTTTEPGYGIYAYEIQRTGDEYFLGLTDAHAGETGKVYSEALAAGLAQVAMVSETFLRNSLESAVSSTGGRGFGISGAFSYSSQRINTGSHADLEGGSGLITLSYNKMGSPVSLGVFGEMFAGSYETGNTVILPSGTFEMKSKGNIENYGGGLFLQYRKRLAEALASGAFAIWTPGPHLEALARAGYSRMDFETSAANPSRFDNKGSMYYGASLGGGYVFEPVSKLAIDLYGYGMWTCLEGKDVDDSLGQHIEFQAADSLRIVSGFRASYLVNERVRPYAGIALDWETLGRPKVSIDGIQANQANISGVSGLFELGVGHKAGDSVFIDIKAAASAGIRDGIGGLMEIKYRF